MKRPSTHSAPRRLVVASALLLLVGLLAGTATAADSKASLKPTEPWLKALEPLRTMPVQDYGFVRSAFTFAENHLLAISGKRTLRGADPFEAVVALLSQPDLVRYEPLIKLGHPDLVAIFGAPRISLTTYRDRGNQQKMIDLLRADQEKWSRPINELEYKAQRLEGLEASLAIVPRKGEWLAPSAVKLAEASDVDRAIVTGWNDLKRALAANDPAAGAEAATALSEAVETAALTRGVELPNLKLDFFYHRHQPFKWAAYWYTFAAIAYLGAWLVGRPRMAWAGYAMIFAGFVEQAIGTWVRWELSGRAPLSNMFESFTFAIGGMILFALVFEAIYKSRIAGGGAAVLGFVFMVLAHKAPIFDSQIRPLAPALQSSWLTYHVITIMLSYSAFALSFFVSIIYLVKDLGFGGDVTTNPLVRRLPTLEAMDVFNYRIIAVGFPLLTAGVILGAVWAATAWGRPWGFDPKETWSAITWMIYAVYLHVRFLVGWQGRRASILAIIGFLAVLFTYLGVNYLLPGLHSYA